MRLIAEADAFRNAEGNIDVPKSRASPKAWLVDSAGVAQQGMYAKDGPGTLGYPGVSGR
jgi:hypothetical protein